MNELHFRAPWSTTLKVVSASVCVILTGVSLSVALNPGPPPAVKALLGGIVFLTLSVNALFTVRGYALNHEALYVKRLLWWTRIQLTGLISATADSQSCRGAIRLLGNGGLFAFSGWYRNRKLGRFRMCATDLKRAVVLRFADRTWVISPEPPESFVREVKMMTGLGRDSTRSGS
jgi:hypothetical protein